MTNGFTVGEWSIKSVARNQCSIPVSVAGFWSRDPVSIYCHRRYSGQWKFSVNVSSGGRDDKVIASDGEAYINYGEAIVAAACVAQELERRVDEIEAEYQAYSAELALIASREEAERQAKYDMDQPLGRRRAKQMLEVAIADAGLKGGVAIEAYRRGSDIKVMIYVERMMKTVISWGGGRISKQYALELLEDCSARPVVE